MIEHDADVLAWSERQAALLQQLMNERELHEAPDWANIIDEIREAGFSALRTCRMRLLAAFYNDLKAKAWPEAQQAPHWRSEARIALFEFADAWTPSMRQKIDLACIYARALKVIPFTVDGHPPQPLPSECPVTLDELFAL